MELTFGEQVKVVLKRKGMTIKQLAEIIEDETGKKMSRQNLTQRLGRDNFQEQDMRMIASILGCPFQLSILDEVRKQEELPGRQTEQPDLTDKMVSADSTQDKESAAPEEKESAPAHKEKGHAERDITVGELIDINEELDTMLEEREKGEQSETLSVEELLEEMEAIEAENAKPARIHRETQPEKTSGWKSYLQRKIKRGDSDSRVAAVEEERPQKSISEEPFGGTQVENIDVYFAEEENPGTQEYISEEIVHQNGLEHEIENNAPQGEINPYTGQEYKSNSVRVHPKRIGYVQVYDREEHKWTDMTEWAFLGYQERKKALLGKDYEPPVYLD